MLKARWNIFLEMQENMNSVQVNKINWHVPSPLTPGGWPQVDSRADPQDSPLQICVFCMKGSLYSLSFKQNVFLYLETSLDWLKAPTQSQKLPGPCW